VYIGKVAVVSRCHGVAIDYSKLKQAIAASPGVAKCRLSRVFSWCYRYVKYWM